MSTQARRHAGTQARRQTGRQAGRQASRPAGKQTDDCEGRGRPRRTRASRPPRRRRRSRTPPPGGRRAAGIRGVSLAAWAAMPSEGCWTRPCGAGGRGCAGRAPGPGPRCPRTRPRAQALRAAPARAPSPAGTSARAGAKKGTRHSMRAQTRARAHTHTHTRSETAKRGVDGYVLAGFGTTEGPEVPRGRPPARPPLLLPRCLAFLTRSHAHAHTHVPSRSSPIRLSVSTDTYFSLPLNPSLTSWATLPRPSTLQTPLPPVSPQLARALSSPAPINPFPK